MVFSVFLLAIAASLSIFCTALWSTGRVADTTGPRRTAHMAVVGLAIAVLSSVGLGAPMALAQACAGALAVASLALLAWEERRIWPICMAQAGLSVLVAWGLPFAHA